jgi:hypothetical protein
MSFVAVDDRYLLNLLPEIDLTGISNRMSLKL